MWNRSENLFGRWEKKACNFLGKVFQFLPQAKEEGEVFDVWKTETQVESEWKVKQIQSREKPLEMTFCSLFMTPLMFPICNLQAK